MQPANLITHHTSNFHARHSQNRREYTVDAANNRVRRKKTLPGRLLEEDPEAPCKPRKGHDSNHTHAEHELECLPLHI